MTTMDHRPPPERSEPERILAGELTAVRGELTRIDAKAGTLLGLASAGTAFVLAASTKTGGAEKLFLTLAALTLAASALTILLCALRPRFGPTSFNAWEGKRPMDVLAAAAAASEGEHLARDLAFLSGLVARKFRALRYGIDLMAAGIVLLAAATLTKVIG